MIVSTSVIMWLVLTVHTSFGGDLSTRQVFTLLSLLTSLRLSFYFFVLALLGFSEGRVAIQRIQVAITLINKESAFRTGSYSLGFISTALFRP
jgi:hypothetical protein